MSKYYPPSDNCTSITIGGIQYNTVLAPDHITCDNCDLQEICQDSQDDAFSLFCATHVEGNHYFKKVKSPIKN